MAHHVQWTAPAPFWKRATDLSDSERLATRRPAILRFASDSFMEEFNRALEVDPSKLTTLEAHWETWREPRTSAPVVAAPARAASRLQQKVARARASAQRRVSMFTTSSGVALAEPPASPGALATDAQNDATHLLKLYQPAHQRFYLIASALVCRIPGLPDHTVNAALQEKTTFVLRRIRTLSDPTTNATTRAEYGFVAGPGGGSWRRIASPDSALTPTEEQLPLFAVNFTDDGGQKRRVLAGLIPVGRREAYVGATEERAPVDDEAGEAANPGTGDAVDPGAPPPPVDPRIALLSADVIEPWKALVVRAAKVFDETMNDPNNVGHQDVIDLAFKAARNVIQVGSWYVLLDFATFLDRQLHDVWLAITSNATPPTQAQRDVVAAIAGATRPGGLPSFNRQTPSTLKDALAAVVAFRAPLERASGNFDGTATPTAEWPNFVFPLADPQAGGPEPAVTLPTLPPGLSAAQVVLRKISALRDLIAAALPKTPTYAVPELPLAAKPIMAPDETARFVVRCVLERPECSPIDPVILSAPSREFELASFFDTDAPARPIRISLPIDTSPAGLRRAPKNTAFVMSNILCGQVNRAKSLGLVDLVLSVLPWPFHKDLPNAGGTPCKTDAGLELGMICSLSIPIITIIALILLFIFVILFDIIFHWIPFFFFCFPVPKFSAKPPEAPALPLP
jgi:hypothetical protein